MEKKKRASPTRVEMICVICGNSFVVGGYRAKTARTCGSPECKTAIKQGNYNPFYGKSHAPETKAKISHANRGEHTEVDCTCGCGEKVLIPAHRIKRNKTGVFFVNPTHLHTWLVGENHWNYRGGYIYYGDGWTKVSLAVRERDKVCQICGKTAEENGRALDVHHKTPARVNLDNSMENLIALCKSCHHKVTKEEEYAYPLKVPKQRKCLACNEIFVPMRYQRFCSDDCKRKRIRQYEKKYIDTHPGAYQKRRQRIKRWQQVNKDRVNASHQQGRLRRKNPQ